MTATITPPQVRARGIPFSGPMMVAVLDDMKTVTRRLVRLGREFQASTTPGYDFTFRGTPRGGRTTMLWQDMKRDQVLALCPYGQPGDLLWPRERHAIEREADGSCRVVYFADRAARDFDGDGVPLGPVYYLASKYQPKRWRPSIHLPRWASRASLLVREIGIERVQEITDAEAIAEGVKKVRDACYVIPGYDYDTVGLCHTHAITPFIKLWNELHAHDGCDWEANPFVWRVAFVRLESA